MGWEKEGGKQDMFAGKTASKIKQHEKETPPPHL